MLDNLREQTMPPLQTKSTQTRFSDFEEFLVILFSLPVKKRFLQSVKTRELGLLSKY